VNRNISFWNAERLRDETSAATARLLADHDVHDLTVEDPPIEDVIEQVFAS